MTDAGLFVGFGQPVRGREQLALQVFNEALQYYGELEAAGEIADFETVLLEPHGGDLSGYILLRGDATKLAGVRASEDFQRLSARAGLVVENFGVVGASLGAAIERQMALYQEGVEELAAVH